MRKPLREIQMTKGKDPMLGGVCSGLAEYFKIDPIWMRILFILLPNSVAIYIVLYLLMDDAG